MSPVKDLIAMPAGSKIDPKHLLGYLTLYTLPDQHVEYRLLMAQWAIEGLNGRLPKPPEALNVFQQACASVASRRTRGMDGNEVLVQQAASGGGECIYQITHSVRDRANKVVEHPKAMSVRFADGKITVTKREDYKTLADLERRIRDHYAESIDKVTPNRVRAVVRDTIVGELHGTNYMNKGVYLVPAKGLKVLESLGRILKALYGEAAHMTLIPVISTRANRDDLSRFHTQDVQDRATALIGRITERLSAGATPRKDMIKGVLAEFREIKAVRDQIAAIIGRETQAVDDQLAVMREQIEKLLSTASADGGTP